MLLKKFKKNTRKIKAAARTHTHTRRSLARLRIHSNPKQQARRDSHGEKRGGRRRPSTSSGEHESADETDGDIPTRIAPGAPRDSFADIPDAPLPCLSARRTAGVSGRAPASLPKRGKGRQEPPLSLLHGRAPNHGLALARRKGKGTGTGTAAAAGLLRSGRWVFRSASCLFLHSEHPR